MNMYSEIIVRKIVIIVRKIDNVYIKQLKTNR